MRVKGEIKHRKENKRIRKREREERKRKRKTAKKKLSEDNPKMIRNRNGQGKKKVAI